jgi:aminoglycoside phosphotransferase (APT) family kinase protein
MAGEVSDVMNMHGAAQTDSDETLVRTLIRDQFPWWSDLAVQRVESDGTSNAIYRVGPDLVARLPLVANSENQVVKEHTWLPRVAPLLPLAVPEPVAMGQPGRGYPWKWSIHRWIEGENFRPDRISDMRQAVEDMASFVRALHAIDLPDPPFCRRAVPLSANDDATRKGIADLRNEFDADVLTAIWDEALAAPPWLERPVWVHADLTDGNILVRDGRITAVIDWSMLGPAEPANDLDVAWDLFHDESRAAYRDALDIDDATWVRARGWAVQSVIGVLYYRDTNPGIVARCRRRLHTIIQDHNQF